LRFKEYNKNTRIGIKMTNSDKVTQAVPIVKMLRGVSDLRFELVDQAGYFVILKGTRILETDTLPEGQAMVSSLNTVFLPIISNFVNRYENKIGNIIA